MNFRFNKFILSYRAGEKHPPDGVTRLRYLAYIPQSPKQKTRSNDRAMAYTRELQ
jgi:hypothetical protein